MKRPAFQFYPADWRKDLELQSCSIGARGLWHEMMCVMHEAEPYGYLVLNGKPMSDVQAATACRVTPRDYRTLLAELRDAGVPGVREDDGAIFSRRMVKDEQLRQVRAAGGPKGGEYGAKGGEYGAKGGRPRKATGDKKPPLNPPPSSSSSTSPSGNTSPPVPPEGGNRGSEPKGGSIAFPTFLQRCKDLNEKHIPENDAVWEFAERAHISDELLRVHWKAFSDRYRESNKRYRDWRQVFRNSVKGNWFGVWRVEGNGTVVLSSRGELLRRGLSGRGRNQTAAA